MPRVTIYGDQTATAENDISAVYAVLMNNGFAAADITVVQCDESVAAAFGLAPNDERGLRITCEGKTIAVGIADIKKAEADGRLRALAPPAAATTSAPVSWWNPAAALMSYWTGGAKKEGPSLGEPEYEVIRYNWLWRPQQRIYRFGDATFDRLRPDTRLVRETFAYKDISKMELRNEQYLVITFRNGQEEQHLESPFVSVIRDLILLRFKALSLEAPVA